MDCNGAGDDIGDPNPINFWTNNMTMTQCENACLNQAGCVGLQYHAVPKQCFLKTALQNCFQLMGANIVAWAPLSKLNFLSYEML